jgi:hypothetical protein
MRPSRLDSTGGHTSVRAGRPKAYLVLVAAVLVTIAGCTTSSEPTNPIIGHNPEGIIKSVAFIDPPNIPSLTNNGEPVVAPLHGSTTGRLLILIYGTTCKPQVELGAPTEGTFTVNLSRAQPGPVTPGAVASCGAAITRHFVEAILSPDSDPYDAEYLVEDNR